MSTVNLFLATYGTFGMLFAGMYQRAVPLLAPIACLLASVGITSTVNGYLV